MSELDPDLPFILEELTKNINFPDIYFKITNNKLHFDVYHKPTNSFSYIHYKSCHPPQTENNIALSLARRIARIVTDNKDNQLQELKGHFLKRKHPEKIIHFSFTKLLQPRKHENNNKNVINFTRTCNANHQLSFKKIKNCIKTLQMETFKNLMMKNTPYYTTNKEIRNLLVQTKFETKTIPKASKLTSLFLCNNRVYHKAWIHYPLFTIVI